MKRFFLLGALSVLLACGGADNSSGLNGSFAGTWNGATTLTLAGYSPYSYPASLVIAVNGAGATASNICPGIGDLHTLTLQVSGNNATWSGILVCNPVQFSECSSVVFTFNNASAALNSGGSLSGQGSGSASGCGMTLDFTFAFTGQQH